MSKRLRRLLVDVLVFVVLALAAALALSFAHSFAILDDAKRCAPNFMSSQWPKYIGCAMAAHENLAGGIIAAAGALLAAWIAFDAVQAQIVAEQRAWVTVGDLQFETDPLVFSGYGADITISVKVANVGRTPALAIHTEMKMLFDIEDAVKAIKTLGTAAIRGTRWTRTLMPGEAYRRQWAFVIPPPKPGKAPACPSIIGCTTYTVPLDNTIHQTAFAYNLFECHAGQPQRFLGFFDPARTPIPKDRLGSDGSIGGFAT